MASISWGVEKPVSMSTCAKHCKCATETTSFLGKQTELLFPPDPLLSWPAILQWLRPNFSETSLIPFFLLWPIASVSANSIGVSSELYPKAALLLTSLTTAQL